MLFPISIYKESAHRLAWGPEELEALKADGWSTEKPALIEPIYSQDYREGSFTAGIQEAINAALQDIPQPPFQVLKARGRRKSNPAEATS